VILRHCSIARLEGNTALSVEENGAIRLRGDTITWVGRDSDLAESESDEEEINCDGRLVTPGLIDCHTHLPYFGHRSREFEMRLNGASYEDIASEGGGISSTIASTQSATEQQLLSATLDRLDRMGRHGTTTVEVKSGYGGDPRSELRLLHIVALAQTRTPLSLIPTCLGLHISPEESRDRSEYVNEICERLLPEVVRLGLAESVDAFCESIAFTVDEVRNYYQAATNLGLRIKGHVDQLSNGGGAQILARFHALSADHLEYSDETGIAALANAGTVAVLLPGAFYFLRESQAPPVELLRRYGVPIAVATDANPGTSPLLSLPLAMNLACTLFRLTPAEAYRGVTVNAARALGLSDRGALRATLRADIAIWDLEHPAELAYFLGESYLWSSICAGKIVVAAGAVDLS
jgi:imidazolonepropionase